MATVYLAQDLKRNREVALKVLRMEVAQTLGADRCLREIEIAARHRHPHILPPNDSGTGGDAFYYIFREVEGTGTDREIQVSSIRRSVTVPLYTKCMKCGGWKQMPENPTPDDQMSTGMMMNLPEPPKHLCTCDTQGSEKGQ